MTRGRYRLLPWLIGSAIFALLIATRFVHLGADPPYWFHECILDEGWWSDSARGKVFFNDYYADDFGTSYLVTPLYTWALELVYRLAGVGLVQTRIVAVVCSVLCVIVTSVILFRLAGRKGAAVGAILLTVSPFFWAHARVAVIEPVQTCFALTSFALWLLARGSIAGATASGLAMAVGIAAKPNTLTLELPPMVIAMATTFLLERKKNAFLLFRAAGLFMVGLGGGLLAVFLVHVVPNWDRFWPMLLSESEAGENRWTDMLRIPGLIMVSERIRTVPIFWRVAQWSPLIIAGVWVYLLMGLLTLRQRDKDQSSTEQSAEIIVVVWAFFSWLMVCASYADRRFVLPMPGFAMLATLGICRLGSTTRHIGIERCKTPSYGFSIMLWTVLLLPAMLFIKPVVSHWIMLATRNLHVGKHVGLGYENSGTLFMVLWLVVILLAASLRLNGVAWSRMVVVRVAPLLLLMLFAVEICALAGLMVTSRSTFVDRQRELRTIIKPGETVMGHMASTLLISLPVRTVRRSLPVDRTPPPNADVWDRLRPRYIIETRRMNFHPDAPLYDDLVRSKGYRSLLVFDAGPIRDGISRYQFELLELPGRQRQRATAAGLGN